MEWVFHRQPETGIGGGRLTALGLERHPSFGRLQAVTGVGGHAYKPSSVSSELFLSLGLKHFSPPLLLLTHSFNIL